MNEREIEPGFLIVASPSLLDPNFARTVVLIITHDDGGTFGVVLNRPLDRTLVDVLPDVDPRGGSIPLFQGGPVQDDMLQVLTRHAGSGRMILPGVALGTELETLLDSAPEGDGLRGYVGYAGWGGGQLESETAEGAWIIAPARPEHVFDVPSDDLWVTVLRELGGHYGWLSMEGGDPSAN